MGICGISGWDIEVGNVYVFVLREVYFGDLEFSFIDVNVVRGVEWCV